MTILTEEIPFTNAALKIYVSEIEKRMDYLSQFVNESRRLKFRLKKSLERLEKHSKYS